jgi:hypothetical protein
MTQTNKKHQMIDRAKLDAGIAEMMAVKPKEKVAFTQREAIEEAAGAVQHMLAMGYSLSEVVAKMNDAFGLTLDPGTVRSYLREVKAANPALKPEKTTKRRGPKKQIQDVGTEPSITADASETDKTASDDDLPVVAMPDPQPAADDKVAGQTAGRNDIELDSAGGDTETEDDLNTALLEELADGYSVEMDSNMEGRS